MHCFSCSHGYQLDLWNFCACECSCELAVWMGSESPLKFNSNSREACQSKPICFYGQGFEDPYSVMTLWADRIIISETFCRGLH